MLLLRDVDEPEFGAMRQRSFCKSLAADRNQQGNYSLPAGVTLVTRGGHDGEGLAWYGCRGFRTLVPGRKYPGCGLRRRQITVYPA